MCKHSVKVDYQDGLYTVVYWDDLRVSMCLSPFCISISIVFFRLLLVANATEV